MFKEYALFKRTISNVLCLYDKNKNFIEMKTQNGNKGRDIAILNEVIKEGPPPQGR